MKNFIAIAAAALVFLAPAAGAELIQSGYIIADTEDYEPGPNGDPSGAGQGNFLANPGFEDGVLTPWTTDNWVVTSADANSGQYSAEDFGNFWIRQDFTPVDVADVQSISMYSKQPEGLAFQAVDFFYGVNDFDEFLVGPGVDWTFIDMTAQLRGGGQLEAIRIWGYSGGGGDPDLTRVDDVLIDVDLPTAADATTWGRIKTIYR
jgi:hypothetical protein